MRSCILFTGISPRWGWRISFKFLTVAEVISTVKETALPSKFQAKFVGSLGTMTVTLTFCAFGREAMNSFAGIIALPVARGAGGGTPSRGAGGGGGGGTAAAAGRLGEGRRADCDEGRSSILALLATGNPSADGFG